MAEPLPCPFCGHLPTVLPEYPEVEGSAWAAVECRTRRCPARPRVEDGAKAADYRGPAAYKRLAVKRWNRRHD